MKWISTEESKPKEGEDVLLNIVYQRFCDGELAEDEIVVAGKIKDQAWIVGNEMLFWDYDFNIGFTDDDVTHWMPLPASPKS